MYKYVNKNKHHFNQERTFISHSLNVSTSAFGD